MDMIQAGYGDIVGKYSALNDWRLSQIVNGEYFCQEIYDLTFQMVHKTLKLADGLVKREEESVKVLMEALVAEAVARGTHLITCNNPDEILEYLRKIGCHK